jgi:hypothetical protein
LQFISIAKSLPQYNESIHDWFASHVAKSLGSCIVEKKSINHHYCMPTSYSIALGTYIERPGVAVPIFYRPGKSIFLFETDKSQSWGINLAGEDKILIPHG